MFKGRHVDELRAATEIDLGYLADEVTALADRSEQDDYAAGLASYERARDLLDAAREPADFVAICREIGAGRHAMARLAARAERRESPRETQPCFFDPGHGAAVEVMAWTPEGLDARPVPVCADDAALIDAGLQPEPRTVVSGSDTVAFWSAPEHFAYWFQGYHGAGDGCIPVEMLDGFPLGSCFAEPAGER